MCVCDCLQVCWSQSSRVTAAACHRCNQASFFCNQTSANILLCLQRSATLCCQLARCCAAVIPPFLLVFSPPREENRLCSLLVCISHDQLQTHIFLSPETVSKSKLRRYVPLLINGSSSLNYANKCMFRLPQHFCQSNI